jgi:ribosome-associated protein
MEFTEEDLLKEVVFKTSRSGGSGGQNVNKVATKVEVKFDIQASALFNEDEKALIRERLSSRLSADNSIRVVSQEARSQLANKQTTLLKLYNILTNALRQDKPRKPTKPKRSAVEKRLKEKQLIAQKKITRRRDFY